jgi:hypothetical protein
VEAREITWGPIPRVVLFPLAKFFEIFIAGAQQHMEPLSYLPFSQEKIILGVETITEQIGTQN